MPDLRAVPFTAVQCDRGFWHDRIETNRSVTIPTAFAKCEESGRFWNFERAAAALRGETVTDRTAPGYPFDDTDVYKVLEGAAYALATRPDPALDAYLDRAIAKVAAAQEPDGYLYTTRTLCPEAPHAWAAPERWDYETDLSHELYNLGHLFEAAVAHYEATGKRALFDLAIRAADLLVHTFGPSKRSIWPGHPITEMALVRLARATNDARYASLARFLLDERGPDGKPRSGDPCHQSHARVLEQSTAVGHAVRAMYLYAGMADVAAVEGAPDYVAALDRLWNDVVTHHLYVTGGVGSDPSKEAFGPPDVLPNLTAYNETCAAIGLVYFAHRLFLIHGHGSAIDVLERSLYNGLLAGVSLDGTHFFYPNPLESTGDYARKPWFGCACCPGNIARFLASVPGYVLALRGDELYVNLFASGRGTMTLDDGRRLALEQATDYPWDGRVAIRVSELPAPSELALKIRIPGWARGEVVPSDLYAFLDRDVAPVTLSVNGRPAPADVRDGYVTLRRTWHNGDRVELELPMPVRRVVANARVAENRGRVALQRGPLVFALEGHDHARGDVRQLALAGDTELRAAFRPELLGGIVALSGRARGPAGEVPLTAISYFAWANRGPTEMTVWIPAE